MFCSYLEQFGPFSGTFGMIEAFEGMRRASEVRRAEVKKSLWTFRTISRRRSKVCGRK